MRRGRGIAFSGAYEDTPTDADKRAVNEYCAVWFSRRSGRTDYDREIRRCMSDNYNGWY